MGEREEQVSVCIDGYCASEANVVRVSPQEDRSRSKSAVGEVSRDAKEGGIRHTRESG
jgi:hypothetical protein